MQKVLEAHRAEREFIRSEVVSVMEAGQLPEALEQGPGSHHGLVASVGEESPLIPGFKHQNVKGYT